MHITKLFSNTESYFIRTQERRLKTFLMSKSKLTLGLPYRKICLSFTEIMKTI
jgi:hypothetical protein